MTRGSGPFEWSRPDLTPEERAILERLAEQVHVAWMAVRIARGWTPGAARDEVTRTHPCLIAYRDLPDDEKEVDRQMALAALRELVAMGLIISRAP